MEEPIDIASELANLAKMPPKQLRKKYAELYGEQSRSGNRQWLMRRCAWRLQSLVEGGISERARRRARELARDQDIRIIPPKGMAMPPLARSADVVQKAGKYVRHPHDTRLPMPGQQIKRVYKGHLYHVDVLDNGFAYDGQRYRSLTAVAHAITGGHWNGFKFFGLDEPNKENV